MASDQLRRNNQVEKDRVPKMASHFQSLADNASETAGDSHPAAIRVTQAVATTEYEGGGKADRQMEAGYAQNIGGTPEQRARGTAAHPVKVGGIEVYCGGARGTEQHGFEEKPGGVKFEVHSDKGGGEKNNDKESLEGIGKYRQTAQQNSMDAVRMAQEKYETAKQSASQAIGSAGEKASAAKDTALQKGQQAFVATKDTLSNAGKTAMDYTVPKTEQAKDTLTKAGDYTVQAKDRAAEMSKNAASYAGQKAAEAKDRGAEMSKNAGSYAGQKAVDAKDATVGGGKVAAQYAGKVAGTVKEKATVVGWEAARFTAEKAADATNVAAGVAATVAGYAGQTAIAAKDVVAGAGKSAAGYAGDKLAAAKNYVVSAEESAADYAARKKAEAERDAQAKKPAAIKGETRGGGSIFSSGNKQETRKAGEGNRTSGILEQGGGESKKQGDGGGGGIFQAIGETIVEIGQTTKELVTGADQLPGFDDMETESEGTVNKAANYRETK